jgi:hypothetical protein
MTDLCRFAPISDQTDKLYRLIESAQKIALNEHLSYVADLLDLAAVSIDEKLSQKHLSKRRLPRKRRWRWTSVRGSDDTRH